MSFMKFDGREVYYETHGQGDTVILLHHGFGSSKMWKEIYPALVDNGYRAVMYDRRGFGLSEAGSDFADFFASDQYRPYSVEELAALVTQLGLDDFHLVCQCEAGVIGVDYAAQYPEQVKTLSISSTLCYSEKRMEELVPLMFPPTFAELDDGFRSKMIYWHGAEKAEAFYENGMEKGGGAYGVGVHDLRPALPGVQCPALVLFPDRSGLFAVEQGVMHYRHLPAGELVVLPRCGHHTYEQMPEEYCRQVLGFFDRYYTGL
ncbi:MAG: alpha/beta hydrolase [Deltaproteobacteria bacterium]|nr:alpha/beta hydrolase [Deltaproteobacteria bacterium]MBW1818564.1 alpha/beta hydrolase [Deltaproteobacteria bacterium]MBW2283523.1 alpha/beta hydrolase [Deltaproteobacteria bacterium]